MCTFSWLLCRIILGASARCGGGESLESHPKMRYNFRRKMLRQILRVKDMPWPQTGATHYHAKIELSDRNVKT